LQYVSDAEAHDKAIEDGFVLVVRPQWFVIASLTPLSSTPQHGKRGPDKKMYSFDEAKGTQTSDITTLAMFARARRNER